MEEVLKNLFDEVDNSHEEMMALWKKLVNRDCGSGNKAGVDSVGRDIQEILEGLGFKVRFHEYEKAGNMLVADYGDFSKPFIVLTGHMDTVFKDGQAAERPFTVKDGKAYGPGVLDMKGGVTILLMAMKLLTKIGYDRYGIRIILAGDEEVGHGSSPAGNDFLKEAKGAVMGFNMETGFMDNGIVIERKGCRRYRIDVDGVGAHAGNNPEDGRSAVEELCHKILDIQKLTDFKEGTTLNCGVIGGGTVANAIPEHAWCILDIRFRTQKGLDRVDKALKEIEKKVYVPDTKTTIKVILDVPAMEKRQESIDLCERANTIAIEAGLAPIHPIAVGGGSDSAFLVYAGVPTICALGVRGEFNHTVREYAVVDSLFEREKMLLALLMKL